MTEYDLGKVVGDDGETGNGIASITKTGTSGKVDTYTILYTNGDSDTFTVTNGDDASVTIVPSWNSTTSDSKVPSEKLAKDSLDGKLDNAISSTAVSIASNDNILITDYSDSNKVKRVANILAGQVKDSTAHSNIGSSANDTQATINGSIDTALSNKISKSNTSGLVKNDGSIDTNSYSTFSGSYNDLSNKPSIPSKISDLTNDSDFIETSSTSGLVKNDGSIDTNSYLTISTASSTYQPLLSSGSNIKTVNNESLLGSGNITIQGGSEIVTSWGGTLSDSKVPSEKLAKNSLDGKLDNALSSTAVTIASNDNILITDYSDSDKIKRVSSILASQVKDGTAHANIGSSANDTQATINTDINTALGNKISKSSTSGLVKNDGSIDTSTYLTSSALSNYIQKSNTSGLVKNDGSIDTSAYITSSAINGMLTSSDIADNLTTNDSTKVLSAKQGYQLNQLIGQAIAYINQ